MDAWKQYDIVHRHHRLMNPVNAEKLEELYTLLAAEPGSRAIDIGCGKGEMLIRLAEDYKIKGKYGSTSLPIASGRQRNSD